MRVFNSKFKSIIVLFLVASLLVPLGALWLRFQLRDLGHLTVRFFDVGQGDAALVTTPAGNQILIDGGPDNTLLYEVGRALPPWDRTIELLVVTHPHADHLVGLIELLRRYRVRQVVVSGLTADTAEYRALVTELRQYGVPEVVARGPAAQRLEPDLELRWLHPTASTTFGDNPNNASVVAQLVYGQTHVLFTGDLESAGQELLPQSLLGSDVLKVPHHGSADALNPLVLSRIAPKFAVISVGKNSYGHPSPRVSKALERFGAAVVTTFQEGDVTVQGDGRQLWFFTRRTPRRQLLPVRAP